MKIIIYKIFLLIFALAMVNPETVNAMEMNNKVTDYSYLLNYKRAVNLPDLSTKESSIKIAIISDGVASGIPGLPEVKTSFNAVTSTEYKTPDLLDYQALLTTPSVLGTFTAGILSSKIDTPYPRFKGVLENSEIYSINIFDGVSTTDKIYANALNYARKKSVDLVLVTSSPYDSLSIDKAKDSCSEIKKLKEEGVVTVVPVSSNYNFNTFSLADCSNSIKVGYLDENLQASRSIPSRKADYYLPGSDFLSYTLSSDKIPFGYSSSDLWSATLMAGIIGNLKINTNFPIATILKSLDLGAIIKPISNEKIPNYENSLEILLGNLPSNDYNLISENYTSKASAKIKSITTDGLTTEISIQPLNSGLKAKYRLSANLYNEENKQYTIIEHNFAPSEVRFKLSQPFSTGSFLTLKTITESEEIESIPYSAATLIKIETLSDHRAKINELSAKWVKEGIMINSITDSKYGDKQNLDLVIVDNNDWVNLAQLEIKAGSYLFKVPLNSVLRKIDLGIGLTLNLSEKRILLPSYYNTNINIESVNSKTSLITIKSIKECQKACYSKPAIVMVNKKKYNIIINQKGQGYLYLHLAKSEVKSVSLRHPYLNASIL